MMCTNFLFTRSSDVSGMELVSSFKYTLEISSSHALPPTPTTVLVSLVAGTFNEAKCLFGSKMEENLGGSSTLRYGKNQLRKKSDPVASCSVSERQRPSRRRHHHHQVPLRRSSRRRRLLHPN
ncbi:hypothetical protein OGAPHI_005660 [Ogataea philodendri]|uniref:Uncharacterized protein n=1 Tax=Ogataea philodendri TaxID=1378263 RepID=A0A9P8NY69_9ASCO|nr:uncharacterized protein OGAPHI_005660 [Ogataea philodendri]KAH3662408.1 hypothetical protein OGAPHI_005660 [Ogataea philodendri]